MADRLRRPTMNDVARAAGVSLKSVSRVINDEVGASPETRERVQQAASQLGYRRNDAAHALRRSDGRSASIGLVLEDISNPFAAVLNRSVERVASAQGSLVLAVSTIRFAGTDRPRRARSSETACRAESNPNGSGS